MLEEIATQQKGNFFVGKVNCEHGDNGALCRALSVPSYPGVAVYALFFSRSISIRVS